MKQPQIQRPPGAHFRAAVTGDTLELNVYDQIGEDFWSGGGITGKTVKAQLDDSAKPFSRVLVRINSPGGDAFEGIAICNILRDCGKPVDVKIDGIAASAASIIAMAGSTITMAKNAMMMIHNAWGFCQGNSKDMRKMGDTLECVSDSIGQTYVERTGKTAAEIKTLMDEETWMSAADCVADGFATALEENNPKAMALGRKLAAMASLKRPVAAKASDEMDCECMCESCMGGDCSECTHEMCDCEGCIDCPMRDTADNTADPAAATQVEIVASLQRIESRLRALGEIKIPASIVTEVETRSLTDADVDCYERLQAQLALARI